VFKYWSAGSIPEMLTQSFRIVSQISPMLPSTFFPIHPNMGAGIAQKVIVTRLWAGRSGGRILAHERDLSLLKNVQTGSGAHTTPYSIDTVVLSRE
jgi:hypothetical protein